MQVRNLQAHVDHTKSELDALHRLLDTLRQELVSEHRKRMREEVGPLGGKANPRNRASCRAGTGRACPLASPLREGGGVFSPGRWVGRAFGPLGPKERTGATTKAVEEGG